MFGSLDLLAWLRGWSAWYSATPAAWGLTLILLLLAYVLTKPWRDRRPPWREAPMVFLVGRPGSGKTLLAVMLGLERMRAGIPVYANFPMWDPVTGRRAGIVRSWDHLRELVEQTGMRNCMVIIDEGNVWATSRRSFDVPTWLLSFWAQRRHYGLELVITAQHEDRVDLVLRETVDRIAVCDRVRFLPKWVPLFKRQDCYPEELTALRAGKAGGGRYHLVKKDAFGAYDTAGIVTYVDFRENREKKAKGQPVDDIPVVHPSYLPGIPAAGWRFWKFSWWQPGELQDSLSEDTMREWLQTDAGQEALRALGA